MHNKKKLLRTSNEKLKFENYKCQKSNRYFSSQYFTEFLSQKFANMYAYVCVHVCLRCSSEILNGPADIWVLLVVVIVVDFANYKFIQTSINCWIKSSTPAEYEAGETAWTEKIKIWNAKMLNFDLSSALSVKRFFSRAFLKQSTNPEEYQKISANLEMQNIHLNKEPFLVKFALCKSDLLY